MMFARQLVSTAMVSAALGLVAAGTAAADSTDDAFLRRLAADGLMFSTAAAVIDRAHVVCGAFSAGMTLADLLATIEDNTAMTPAQYTIFMANAVQAYCPEHADSLFG